jgi:hypothetical protein
MISVLCPSRLRHESLIRSCLSLLTRASDISNVEILVACDPDDWQTQQCEITNTKIRTAPERYGYYQLNRYVDMLAEEAKGEWLMLWNDDAVMRTRGWDKIIQARENRYLLWAKSNEISHAPTFAIWPKAWYDALGYSAPTLHIDTYLTHITSLTGLIQKIPVEIYHDRFDVTGNPDHDDSTYAEGRKTLGPEGMHGEFPYGSLNADADKILALYK